MVTHNGSSSSAHLIASGNYYTLHFSTARLTPKLGPTTLWRQEGRRRGELAQMTEWDAAGSPPMAGANRSGCASMTTWYATVLASESIRITWTPCISLVEQLPRSRWSYIDCVT